MIGPGPSAFLGGAHPLNNLQSKLTSRKNHDLLSIFSTQAPLQIFKDKSFMCFPPRANKAKQEWEERIRSILCAGGACKISFTVTDSLQSPDDLDCVKLYNYVVLEDGASMPSRLTLSGTSSKRRKLTKTASFEAGSSSLERVVDFEWIKQCLICGRLLKAQLWAKEAMESHLGSTR